MLAAWDQRDITIEHAAQMYRQLWTATNYLVRLIKRMQALRFDDDRLYSDLSVAYSAMNKLEYQLHFLSVKCGMGAPEHPRSTDTASGMAAQFSE